MTEAIGHSVADILPEYDRKARDRAAENEARLKGCGAFTLSEFNDFRERLLAAYCRLMHASRPLIAIGSMELQGFMGSGEYLTQVELGRTHGTDDVNCRREYSDTVYGKRNAPYERYGIAHPVGCRLPRQLLRFGDSVLELHDNLKDVSTINAFDSNIQWPSYQRLDPTSDGVLYPVPYVTDQPECYIGCLMQYPNMAEVESRKFKDGGKLAVHCRNMEVLQLLEGNHPTGYIECHVHSRVTTADANVYSFDWYDKHKRDYEGLQTCRRCNPRQVGTQGR